MCPFFDANHFGGDYPDAKELSNAGINVAAIMSNDYQNYPDDSPANMLKFAAQHAMNFPYLVDETQSVAKAYSAICTPDFFGLNATGGLQYRGRLDDTKMNDAQNRSPELLDAMHLIARTGKGPAEQTPSIGCSIKWK